MKILILLSALIVFSFGMISCKYHTVPDGVEIQVVKEAADVSACQRLGEIKVDGPDLRQVYKEAQFQVWQLKGDTLFVRRERKMLIGKLNEYTLEAEARSCLVQAVPELQAPASEPSPQASAH